MVTLKKIIPAWNLLSLPQIGMSTFLFPLYHILSDLDICERSYLANVKHC